MEAGAGPGAVLPSVHGDVHAPGAALSCSHNFCKKCLELILVCQSDAHASRRFCCPVCRKVGAVRGPWLSSFLQPVLRGPAHESSWDVWPKREDWRGAWRADLEDRWGPSIGVTGYMSWLSTGDKSDRATMR